MNKEPPKVYDTDGGCAPSSPAEEKRSRVDGLSALAPWRQRGAVVLAAVSARSSFNWKIDLRCTRI